MQIPEKWFYAYVDLVAEQGHDANFSAKEFLVLLPQLKSQGYCTIVLSCFEFGNLKALKAAEAGNVVRENLKLIVDLACALDVEIIPEVMPVGPSESILQNNYHLAEGKKVEQQVLLLQTAPKNVTFGLPLPRNSITMGDFWGSQQQLEANWVTDSQPVTQLITNNSASLELDLSTVGAEVGQDHLRLERNHQYRLKFRLKTEGVKAKDDFYAKVSGAEDGNRFKLEEVSYKLAETQPWTEYSVLFNSYGCEECKFWFGFTGPPGGKAWIADIGIFPALGPNMLRRAEDPNTSSTEALSVSITDLTDQRELTEGIDYERWCDPIVSSGGFSHDRADIPIRFKSDRIDPSHVYAVSYYHAVLQSERNSHVCCSLRHPKVLDLFRQQIELLNAAIAPSQWLINHDEIRAMGHDPLANGDSPACILQENLKACFEIIKTFAPGTHPIVFNGMYDPNHLGVKQNEEGSHYPMVNGEFFGSSEVLQQNPSQGKATILNWQTGDSDMENSKNAESWLASLRHFKGLDCPQVINAFYDAVGNIESAQMDFVRKRIRTIFQVACQRWPNAPSRLLLHHPSRYSLYCSFRGSGR